MKVVVYSAIFNDYDTLSDLSNLDKGNIDFIVVSNTLSEKECSDKGWKLFPIERKNISFREASILNRAYKFIDGAPKHPLDAIEHDIHVYIDGNKKIRRADTLLSYCSKLYNSEYQMVLSKHWGRSSVREECNEIIALSLAPKYEIELEYCSYLERGFTDTSGLYCASFQIRKNTKEVRNLLYRWSGEYLRFRNRDQISLPFVIEQGGFESKIIKISPVELQKIVEHSGHKYDRYNLPSL